MSVAVMNAHGCAQLDRLAEISAATQHTAREEFDIDVLVLTETWREQGAKIADAAGMRFWFGKGARGAGTAIALLPEIADHAKDVEFTSISKHVSYIDFGLDGVKYILVAVYMTNAWLDPDGASTANVLDVVETLLDRGRRERRICIAAGDWDTPKTEATA